MPSPHDTGATEEDPAAQTAGQDPAVAGASAQDPAAAGASAATPDFPGADGASSLEPSTPEELAAQWEAEGPEPAGPVANLGASLVVLGVGVSGLVLSARLGLGSASQPQAGTWPFVICLVITVLALAQLLVGRKGGEDGEQFSRYSLLAGAGFVSMLAMVFLMPRIGFEIPGALLCFFWMKVLGGETWRAAIIYSLCIIVAFYLIFIAALGTAIPHLF